MLLLQKPAKGAYNVTDFIPPLQWNVCHTPVHFDCLFPAMCQALGTTASERGGHGSVVRESQFKSEDPWVRSPGGAG